MLIIMFIGGLLLLLGFDVLKNTFEAADPKLDDRVLLDQTLAYHLDWDAVRDQKFLSYLYVKKINAIVRYQRLAGVDYEQAQSAIEHLLTHPELLPEIRQKRRPPLPQPDDDTLQALISAGRHEEAALRYARLVDVDPFTAHQVIERLERRQVLASSQDTIDKAF